MYICVQFKILVGTRTLEGGFGVCDALKERRYENMGHMEEEGE